MTPVGLRTISTADAWYFPSYGFGLLGGIWPDLTLWFAVALARNGFVDECVHFLRCRLCGDGRSAARATPCRVSSASGSTAGRWQSRHVSLAVDRREVSVGGRRDGRRARRLSHQRPPASGAAAPKDWQWVAAARVHWGGRRCTYVIDLRNDRSTATCPSSRPKSRSRASMPDATSATK